MWKIGKMWTKAQVSWGYVRGIMRVSCGYVGGIMPLSMAYNVGSG